MTSQRYSPTTFATSSSLKLSQTLHKSFKKLFQDVSTFPAELLNLVGQQLTMRMFQECSLLSYWFLSVIFAEFFHCCKSAKCSFHFLLETELSSEQFSTIFWSAKEKKEVLSFFTSLTRRRSGPNNLDNMEMRFDQFNLLLDRHTNDSRERLWVCSSVCERVCMRVHESVWKSRLGSSVIYNVFIVSNNDAIKLHNRQFHVGTLNKMPEVTKTALLLWQLRFNGKTSQ